MATKHTASKRQKPSPLIPYALLLSCIVFILIGVSFLFAASSRFLVFSQTKPTQIVDAEEKPLPKPVKIYIPRLAKILTISDGYVTDNRWTIAETGVSYLTTSTVPGNVGNSVLYGHNKDDILGRLPNVASGDFIYVVLSDGAIAKFEIFETKEVAPNRVEILDETADHRLTIYTCTGFLDQARFVVVAKLV